MNGLKRLFAILWTLIALDAAAQEQQDKQSAAESTKTSEECQAPKWAIAIGHEQMWKLHNGCPTDEKKAKSSN